MLIGELAERTGSSARALRYYEQHGLVEPRRDSNGYRIYDEVELRVVHKIHALRTVGFELADMHPFVACLRAGDGSGDGCPDSVEELRRKLDEVDAATRRLATIRGQLAAQLADALAAEPGEPACGLRRSVVR
ncbi:MerR family transcriptional regulator [Nocardia sp. NPDC058379]|uniref:MerR family transcriptional regulator n=1 Tax=unclassified Nocardia TaxID=2637762 RepID=UPI00365E0C8B